MRRHAATILLLSLLAASWALILGCQRAASEPDVQPKPSLSEPEVSSTENVAAESPPAGPGGPATLPAAGDPSLDGGDSSPADDPAGAEAAASPAPAPVPETRAEAERAAQLARRESEIARREAEVAAREQRLAERRRRIEEREQSMVAEQSAAPPTSGAKQTVASGAALEPPPPAIEERALEQPAADPLDTTEPAAAPLEVTIREVEVLVPAGTEVEVEFVDTLSSENSQAGDEFRTRVVGTVEVDGYFAIPAGSEISGVVTEAEKLRKIGGRARLAVHFDRLELASGEVVPIRAAFAGAGPSETRKDAAKIGGGAAAGAILGRVIKRRDKREGGLVGSILGAAVGAAIAARTPGEPVVIQGGERMMLELQDDVQLVVRIRQIRS